MVRCYCPTTTTVQFIRSPTDRGGRPAWAIRPGFMQRACRAAASLAALLAGTLPASAADIDEKLAPCLACHGAQGQSELENVPSVGAQTAPYTVIQLFTAVRSI